MRLRFRYRLDPQGRNLVMVDPGASTDDLVWDMVEVVTSCCARLHGRGGARNRALRAVTWAKQPPGAGPPAAAARTTEADGRAPAIPGPRGLGRPRLALTAGSGPIRADLRPSSDLGRNAGGSRCRVSPGLRRHARLLNHARRDADDYWHVPHDPLRRTAAGAGGARGRERREGLVYVVMVASECAPVVQAGGLGEVVFGLSRELEIRGHAVEIVLPKYDCMRYGEIHGLTVAYEHLLVPWYSGVIPCTVWFGFVHGRKCFFIEPHSPDRFFGGSAVYGSDDDVARYAFFAKAAMEFLLKAGKRPDVIHCHDWQTALVPVLLYELYQHLGMEHQRVCLTVHNFRHQGICGEEVLWATGLLRPEHYFDDTRLRDNFNPGALNLLKGGIVYANFVTTVSPQHAWEVLHTDQGMGLGHTLWVHRGKFGGILNGVDYELWNPEIDRYIPHNYSLDWLDPKYGNKQALRQRLWLRDDFQPIVAYVGRLDEQKGVDLIRHAAWYALAQGAQFVLIGSSTSPAISDEFWRLKWQLNDHPDCHLELSYDPELAHLIYAGADMVVMPSMYEPCGLTQLIAAKYATVPIVRAIGGLCDTVFDHDYGGRPAQDRNGYVFHQVDTMALESAMARAIGLWHADPWQFRQLMRNGMRADSSWGPAGHHYVNVYDYVRHK